MDWQEQSARMATIYSNSYINIAATGAADSTGGCFKVRKVIHGPSLISPNSFPINSSCDRESQRVYVRPSLYPVHNRLSTCASDQFDPPDSKITPLLSRAWVFQERQLAPRTIHFHPSEMIMECKTEFRCECTILEKIYKNPMVKLPNIHSLNDRQILHRWWRLMEEYSSLVWTRPSDRLVALMGIATIFQDRLSYQYLAGIWKEDIATGLLWDVRRPIIVEKQQSTNYRLAGNEIFAPSWSWASLILGQPNYSIMFPVSQDSTFDTHGSFELIDTNMSGQATDFHATQTQSITIRALATTAILFHGRQNDPWGRTSSLEFTLDGKVKKSLGST